MVGITPRVAKARHFYNLFIRDADSPQVSLQTKCVKGISCALSVDVIVGVWQFLEVLHGIMVAVKWHQYGPNSFEEVIENITSRRFS